MALPIYKIGNFDFIKIDGNIIPPSTNLELDQRHGVNGTEITDVGIKGMPFSLITHRDYTTYSAAVSFYDTYLLLRGGDPVDVFIADVSTALFNCRCKVLDILPLDIRRIGANVGGLESGGTGFAVLRWDLISISL